MDFKIYENGYFKIEHSHTCAVSGYLIVSLKISEVSFYEMPRELLNELGSVLYRTTYSINKILSPRKIYCALFGEETVAVHFHIFPRTLWLTKAYLCHFPDSKSKINGPVLFDWARNEYRMEEKEVFKTISWIIPRIKQIINDIPV